MKTSLDAREKLGLVFSGLTLALVLGMLVYVPNGPRKDFLQSQTDLKQARHQLVMTQKMKAEEEARLRSQEALMAKLEARPPTFDFFSFVNRILRQTNLTGRAKLDNYRARTVSPKQPMVQLKLQGVSLKELVDFLHQIYSSGNLVALYKMDRLYPALNNQGLDCDLTLVTLKL